MSPQQSGRNTPSLSLAEISRQQTYVTPSPPAPRRVQPANFMITYPKHKDDMTMYQIAELEFQAIEDALKPILRE